jgi:hypothetical protein
MAINEKRVGTINPKDGRVLRNPAVDYVTGSPVNSGDVRIDLPNNRFVFVNASAWRGMTTEQKNTLREELGIERAPTEDELFEAEFGATEESTEAPRTPRRKSETPKDGE